MILKEFIIEHLNLTYYIGISQISVDFQGYLKSNGLKNEDDALEHFLGSISRLEDKYNDSVIQVIDDNYVLNSDHILKSIYFVEKAFLNNLNISKKKNIEILLYLSMKRQIKNGIKAFGLKIKNLKEGLLTFCIISPSNNITSINQELIQQLNAKELELTLDNQSIEKFNKIKNFFEISDNQIKCILKSYDENNSDNLNNLFVALLDLLCEKMAILSLDKYKQN